MYFIYSFAAFHCNHTEQFINSHTIKIAFSEFSNTPVSDNYILGTEILIKAFTSSFLKTWNLFLGLTTNPWMYWWLPIISKKCPQRYIIVTYWGVLLTSAWKSQLSHSCIWGVSEVSLWTLWKRLCARASCSYLSILHTSLRVLIWGRL